MSTPIHISDDPQGGRSKIFDPVRKRYVALTEEEAVRQYWIRLLHERHGVPLSSIAVEASLRVHAKNRRCDLLVYNRLAKASILIECKAPSVQLNEAVFEQIARYNLSLQVPFLVISNGKQTYCSQQGSDQQWHFLDTLPDWQAL